MKRIAAAAVLAAVLGLASPAGMAMYLNRNGLGQALVYPYYTVNGGYTTFFTIVNATSDLKAVKVRLLEGYNGRDVQDFNLYLSPRDYWVGAVVDSGSGGAAIFTNDNSCTVPKLPTTAATALPLTTANFDGTGAQGKDGGPVGVARTREGHIEVIEMGTVIGPGHTFIAITQRKDGIPTDCPHVVNAWADGGQWIVDSTRDIGPPSGGLFGNAMILDAANGTVFSYAADAIAQFYAKDGRGEHSRPDALTPNLSSATSSTAEVHTDRGLLSLTYARPIDAVSALFMADTIENEFWTSAGIGAASEWVVTQPTKRFYVDPGYTGSRQPFAEAFNARGDGTSQTVISAVFSNREGLRAGVYLNCSSPCQDVGRATLAYDTQVITFNQNPLAGRSVYAASPPSQVLASNLVPTNIYTRGRFPWVGDFEANNGWAELSLRAGWPQPQLSPSTDGRMLNGLPVTGFWINRLVNGNVGGALANYTAVYPHRLHVSCETAPYTPCPQ
ncbi:MAG: hypothetical protein JSS42_04295 [Proteobacteria bacterium]|uniref:hypothetical protein n=1 Tax=Rudaea sp. TaxID=2136325 RepID=UPI0032205AD0|nr:hypothetical protein [Pseudomonadota bacterium]